MPIAGYKPYCDAVNANKKLVDQAEESIRDKKEEIKTLELEINKRKKLIKQQDRNCNAVGWINSSIEDGTNISKMNGGRKSRRRKSRRGKSRTRRNTRRR